MLIDDFTHADRASNGQVWRFVSDRVMGGVSLGRAGHDRVAGRPALRLQGDVSLANNGGFIQVNLDLGRAGQGIDASAWPGIEITLLGDGGRYAVNLRSCELRQPWESYRADLPATPAWTTRKLPFTDFRPHRTALPLNTRRLRRIGLIAIGEARHVDVALGHLRFYRAGEA
jgi:hypothetical protein